MADLLLVSGWGLTFVPALSRIESDLHSKSLARHVNFRDLVFRVEAGCDCWKTPKALPEIEDEEQEGGTSGIR